MIRLSRTERAAIFAGDHPRLTFPGDRECPVAPGHIHPLSASVSLEVLAVKRTKGGEWRLDYLLRDNRPQFVRRVPPIHDARKEAERGEPSGEELRRAARESAVTHSPAEAVADAGEVVPQGFQERLSVEGLQRDVAREQDQQRQIALEARLAQARAECRRRGVDVSRLDASIEKRIRAYQKRLQDAA